MAYTPYNLTGFANATNPLAIVSAVNTASNNLVAYLIIISIFIVLVFALIQRNPAPEAFTGASLVCSLIALLMVYAELLSYLWIVGLAIILGGSLIALYRSNSV